MPLYALFCLTRPQAGKEALTQIIRTAGQAVLARGGVLTDVTFFGEQQLAYEIRKPAGKFDQADVWQLQFKAAPSVLEDVDHNLRVDERVLRYLIQKQPELPTMPNTHNVQKWARRILPAAAAAAADAK